MTRRVMDAETRFIYVLLFTVCLTCAILYALTGVALLLPHVRGAVIGAALVLSALSMLAARRFARWLASFDRPESAPRG